MRWDEERYVRLYKRDTADWLALSFDAQALFSLLLRKVDLSGCLELGRHGPKAIAMVLQQVALWETRLKPALEELLADGCVRIDGNTLVMPNYVAAQTAIMSGKLRTGIWRERKEAVEAAQTRETARHIAVTNSDAFIQPLSSQKDQIPPLPPATARGVPNGTVVELKATETPPCGPLNGNGAARPSRVPRPHLRKRKRVETLAETVRYEQEHQVDERSRALAKALQNEPMTEGEALTYANTRWPTGPPNERVVALAFEAYAMRAGAAPGGSS